MRSDSVTRQVSFNRTKIGGKCQNSKIQMRHLSNFQTIFFAFLSDHCNSHFWAKSTKPKVPRVCHHRAVAKNKDVVPAKKLPLQPLPVEIMSWNQVLKILLWIMTQPKIYPHKSFWKTKEKKNCQKYFILLWKKLCLLLCDIEKKKKLH